MLEIFKVDIGVANITISSCGCHTFFAGFAISARLKKNIHIVVSFFLLIPFVFMYDNEEGLKSKIKSWSKSLFISSFTIRFCLSQSHLICLKKGSFYVFFIVVQYDSMD